jgi:hypothetical protein
VAHIKAYKLDVISPQATNILLFIVEKLMRHYASVFELFTAVAIKIEGEIKTNSVNHSPLPKG